MSSNQKIYINSRFLTQPITGVQRFAIEISKVLKNELKDQVVFVTHPGIVHKELAEYLEAKVVGLNKSHFWEQFDLYLYLKKRGTPLLLSFGHTGPIFYKRQIISVHDMAFRYYKDTFSKSFVFIYNLIIPIVSKKGLHVLTVSESAKKEVCEGLELPEKKVTVIYNGLSEVFQKVNENIDDNLINKSNYILTVSSHHQRKNYKRLIEAFSLIEDDSLELFVVGNVGPNFSKSLDENDFKMDDRIKFLTNVSDNQLSQYYQNAKLFVFPSLYEGFGIPVIEAMSKGLLCVLSDIPVFREIGDDSVIYVNPLDINSIKEGIEKGLNNDNKNIVYSKLSNFSWRKSGKKVIEVLKDIEKF